jgi:hypothetical protein
MKPPPGKPKIDALALCIARGQSLRSAAQTLGIGASTASRWARSPGFPDRVEKFRARLVDRAIGRLSRAAASAADTLVNLLDEKHDPDVRIRAAKTILESTGLGEGPPRLATGRLKDAYGPLQWWMNDPLFDSSPKRPGRPDRPEPEERP